LQLQPDRDPLTFDRRFGGIVTRKGQSDVAQKTAALEALQLLSSAIESKVDA